MISETGMSGASVSRLATLIFASIAIGANALPITVTATIPRVYLIEGITDGEDDDLYVRTNIDNSGPQQRGTVDDVEEGTSIFPNWTYTSTIDPRGRSTYDVPIVFELFDEDFGSDTPIDINPAGGIRRLPLTYNLETRIPSLSSPQTGNPPGDRASLYFNISSNPFQYLLDVNSLVTSISPGLFRYEYDIHNQSASTFNIDSWSISNVGTFDLALQPGQSYRTSPILVWDGPVFGNATAIYDDLGHTSRGAQVLVPVPEPTSLALFLAGLAGIGLFRRGRGNRATAGLGQPK